MLAYALRCARAAALQILLALALATSTSLGAKEAAPASADPLLEARVARIAAELRCLVCQNQTIADSNAELAVDLRRQVREMLQRGESEAQILAYMTQRYGDFVLYRPPLKPSTALLWFGPGVLLFGGVAALLLVLRRRSRMDASRFEPDLDDDEPQAPAGRDTGSQT
jgi:cytochrome c-type biogenesis protein CcmH